MAVSVAPTTVPARTVGQAVTTTFTATATGGSGTYTYQWKRGTTNVGTNSATLTLANPVIAGDAGSYTVVVDDGTSTVTSSPARVVTVNAAPSLSADLPATKSVANGAAYGLSVTATGGTTPYTYAWTKDGTAISGQTSASLGGTSALADSGKKFKVVVTDANGVTVTSTETTLTVTPVLKTIALNPTAVSVVADGTGTAQTVTITAATDSGAALPAAASITVTGDTGSKLTIGAVSGTGANRTFTVNGKAGTTSADGPITLTVTAGSGITKTIVVTLT